MKAFSSIRFRLAIWNVGVIAIVLAIFGYSVQFKIRTDLLDGVDNSLNLSQQTMQSGSVSAFLLRHNISVDPQSGTNLPDVSATSSPLLLSNPVAPNSFSPFPISLMNKSGEAVYAAHPALDEKAVSLALRGERIKRTVRFHHQPYRVLSVPYYRNGHVLYVIQFGRPLAQIYVEIDRITRGLLTRIPLALLIVGAGALLLTERALRPVREIVHETEGIEASDLSGRLTVRGADEFSHLACTINNMLGRLDKAFGLLQEASEQQRRFTADASHELRTPLTIIKANSSLALASDRTPEEYRRTLESVDRAADRMGKIVQDLLYIARSDSGQLFLKSEKVNIRSVVQQAVEAIADEKGHVIRQEALLPGLITMGDEDALIRLFTNLLQNASNYTPPGGLISLSSCKKDGYNIIVIADSGVGIAPEHVEHLGERFFRVDNGRARDEGGTGLGLAICRSIVASHDGFMQIESKLGEGTSVTIKLPAAQIKNAGSLQADSPAVNLR
jgi:signal transduction histidine kinase